MILGAFFFFKAKRTRITFKQICNTYNRFSYSVVWITKVPTGPAGHQGAPMSPSQEARMEVEDVLKLQVAQVRELPQSYSIMRAISLRGQ